MVRAWDIDMAKLFQEVRRARELTPKGDAFKFEWVLVFAEPGGELLCCPCSNKTSLQHVLGLRETADPAFAELTPVMAINTYDNNVDIFEVVVSERIQKGDKTGYFKEAFK